MTGFLLSGGGLLLAGVTLLVGAVLPWLYLSRKRSKRLKAFDGQLADTLQLISGSLSAGLSFTQSLDTVVREGRASPSPGSSGGRWWSNGSASTSRKRSKEWLSGWSPTTSRGW